MVIARPKGTQDVPYQTIARPLFAQLGRVHGKVAIEVLRPPTFAALKARLAEAAEAGAPFHVVHFDGHGSFGVVAEGSARAFVDQRYYETPTRYLAFEKQQTEDEHLVAAENFAAALKQGKVPLVVLNACHSGALATMDEAIGAEANVATRLLQEGAAAVVAMSYSIYVVAAAAFMAVFYEQLLAGRSVSSAVAAGRHVLREQNLRPSLEGELPLQDWLVPVHYKRADIALPELARQREAAKVAPDAFFAGLLDEAKHLRAEPPADAPMPLDEDVLAPEGGAFFGRDAAFYALERTVRLGRVAVIHGVGGTGKTELVKAFGRWLRDSGGSTGLSSFSSGASNQVSPLLASTGC
jgi:hypothetical protein